ALLTELDPVRRRFVLARALELTRGPAVNAAYVPAEGARALFAAAVALVLPDGGAEFALASGADPDRVAFWAEFFLAHLTEKQLDTVVQFAGPVVVTGAKAFAAWAEGTLNTARRVALVMTGDLAAALNLLRDEDPALADRRVTGPKALRALLERAPALADLYDYAFSGRYHALLRALDIA
ncbi:MAG: hypothetical protein KC620_25185, partial [Myxococcales bacterium]|nr:hypothetical protein [Myxococcales bacterium]